MLPDMTSQPSTVLPVSIKKPSGAKAPGRKDLPTNVVLARSEGLVVQPWL